MRQSFPIGLALCVAMIAVTFRLPAAEQKPAKSAKPAATTGKEAAPSTTPDGLVPLNKEGTVLLDAAKKRLLLKTRVVLREGALEFLCCLKQTKEHEAILSLDAKAYVVHTGLLALGAKTGTPVAFDPEYRAPTGQRIDIFVDWTDEKGKTHREPAQKWVRHSIRRFFVEKLEQLPTGVEIPKGTELRYDRRLKELSWYGPMTAEQKQKFLALSADKAFRRAIESFYEKGTSRQMEAHWVFAGSGVYTDPDSGKKFYLAEDGDLICVANFPGATLDVDVASTEGNEGLLFEAYTERIPPKETLVTIELVPVFAETGKEKSR